MKHIKTFQLWENQGSAKGEYSTEEMDKFVRSLAGAIGDDKVSVDVPSDRQAAAVSQNAAELLKNWEAAVKQYANDKNLTWHVWKAAVGGNFSKPKPLSAQRYDIDDILKTAMEHKGSVRSLSIGIDSDEQKAFAKGMSDWTSGD